MNWALCFCTPGPTILSCSLVDIHTDAPDWLLTITSAATCWQTGPETETISTRVVFDDESMISPYYADRLAREAHLFRGCNNPLAFKQHGEKLRHVHYICGGWVWTHQQIAHDTSTDGSSLGDCVWTSGGGGDGQTSVWGIRLDVSSDFLLLLIIFEPYGQRHGFIIAWSVSSWTWALRKKTCSQHYTASEGHGLLLVWSSSIDTHAAPV